MKKSKLTVVCISFLVILGGIFYYLFLTSLSSQKNPVYVNIYPNDNIDSIYNKIEREAKPSQMLGFKLISLVSNLKSHIHTGQYALKSGQGSLRILRNIRSGLQTPVKLTIPSVRTTEDLAGELSKKLMIDSTTFMNIFNSSEECAKYGCDTATIISIFIPNTYEIYWNIPIDKFMKRMKKESDSFWTPNHIALAKAAGITPVQVLTLASIIDEETANNGEKNDIAGMYLNRFHAGMPLQADPTIKFALKQFTLKRIYTNLTFVKSPYNTYHNIGFPPGPIRIPSMAGINAVLHYTHHNYMYMCAKEDFSGTHNFARTYAEHMVNARKYSKALNAHGIQ